MRTLWMFVALPAVAVAGPFSNHQVLGEMGISQTDPTGLDDAQFTQQIAASGVVGPGIEADLIPPYVWGDFSDVDATMTLGVNTWWAALPFNGLRFHLVSPGAPSLANAYLISTNIAGFTPAQITSDQDTVAINFQGMSAVGEVTIGFGDSPSVTTGGTCPGQGRVVFEHFSPSGNIAVVRGSGVGSSTVPAGPCAGTALPLAGPQLVTTLAADANGYRALSPNFGPGLCGRPIVAIDMMTCTVTPVAYIP